MKRILFSLLAVIALSVTGYSQCNIDTSLHQVGLYPPADSLDCIEANVGYSEVIQFVTPATFDTFGFTLTVDTITVTSITGMPTGINYLCNPTGCVILGGENGCLNLSGTTTDLAGQYDLTINIEVVVTIPGLGQQTQVTTLAALGINYHLTVIDQGTGCRTSLAATISGTPAFCPGSSTTLTADVVNASGAVSYSWSPNGETTQSVNASSADTYSVTVTDQNGTTTANAVVTEDALPVAGFTAAVFGQNGSFTNISADATSYSWDFGDGSTGNTLNASHSYASTGTYTVMLIASNACGSDTSSQDITIVTLSVCSPDTTNRGPGIFPAPDNVGCIERGVPYDLTMQTQNFDSFTLNTPLGVFDVPVTSTVIDSVTNFPCGISAQWDKASYAAGEKGCIYVAGTTKEVVGQYPVKIYMTMTLDVPILGPQTLSGELNTELIPQLESLAGPQGYDFKYVSKVIQPLGTCPARDTTSTSVASGSVCPPLGVAITGNAVICSGTPTTLTAAAQFETGLTSYAWSGGETTASITVSAAGTYSVTVTEQTGGATATSSITVTLGTTPVAGFTATTNRAVVTITQNSSTGTPTSFSWNWGDNSAVVTGQIPPPHTYTSNGTFTITLTATNSCGSDQATQTVITTGVGIQTIENNLDFEVYPNPSSGNFNITLHNNEAKPVMLWVFDLSGKMIYSENIKDLSSTIRKQLDLSSMPKGVYTLHLSSEAGNGIQRLTIY